MTIEALLERLESEYTHYMMKASEYGHKAQVAMIRDYEDEEKECRQEEAVYRDRAKRVLITIEEIKKRVS